MRRPLLSLFLAGAAVLAPYAVFADDATTPAPSTGNNLGESSTSGGQQGERFHKWRAALEQLNLSAAQKSQIKQIRSTVTDRKERRQQIMAVLTADQKQKLMQFIAANRNGAQSGN